MPVECTNSVRNTQFPYSQKGVVDGARSRQLELGLVNNLTWSGNISDELPSCQRLASTSTRNEPTEGLYNACLDSFRQQPFSYVNIQDLIQECSKRRVSGTINEMTEPGTVDGNDDVAVVLRYLVPLAPKENRGTIKKYFESLRKNDVKHDTLVTHTHEILKNHLSTIIENMQADMINACFMAYKHKNPDCANVDEKIFSSQLMAQVNVIRDVHDHVNKSKPKNRLDMVSLCSMIVGEIAVIPYTMWKIQPTEAQKTTVPEELSKPDEQDGAGRFTGLPQVEMNPQFVNNPTFNNNVSLPKTLVSAQGVDDTPDAVLANAIAARDNAKAAKTNAKAAIKNAQAAETIIKAAFQMIEASERFNPERSERLPLASGGQKVVMSEVEKGYPTELNVLSQSILRSRTEEPQPARKAPLVVASEQLMKSVAKLVTDLTEPAKKTAGGNNAVNLSPLPTSPAVTLTQGLRKLDLDKPFKGSVHGTLGTKVPPARFSEPVTSATSARNFPNRDIEVMQTRKEDAQTSRETEMPMSTRPDALLREQWPTLPTSPAVTLTQGLRKLGLDAPFKGSAHGIPGTKVPSARFSEPVTSATSARNIPNRDIEGMQTRKGDAQTSRENTDATEMPMSTRFDGLLRRRWQNGTSWHTDPSANVKEIRRWPTLPTSPAVTLTQGQLNLGLNQRFMDSAGLSGTRERGPVTSATSAKKTHKIHIRQGQTSNEISSKVSILPDAPAAVEETKETKGTKE